MKNEADALKDAINLLQNKQAHELRLLKEQFHITYDSLKPINLIKKGFLDVTASPDIKKTLINNAIGLATGYLSKKVLIGSSHNPIKKLLGTILEFAVASVVVKQVNNTVNEGAEN